jgi:site-specific DNA-methyltransferase (cytosine-N4-specific)
MIIQGNSFEEVPKLPDNSLDCIMTSPPYWGSIRVYDGAEPQIYNADSTCQHEWIGYKDKGITGGKNDHSARKGLENFQETPDTDCWTCSKCGGWKGEMGHEITPQEYLDNLVHLFDLIYQKLKETGVVWINLGDVRSGSGGAGGDWTKGKREGVPTRVAKEYDVMRKSYEMIPERFAWMMIKDKKWNLRAKVVWHKPNSYVIPVKDSVVMDYEMVYMFTKAEMYNFKVLREPRVSSGGNGAVFGGTKYQDVSPCAGDAYEEPDDNMRQIRAVWSINHENSKYSHLATFPIELVRRCVEMGCPENGVVLDPFGGTGTVGVYCKNNKRDFILIELSPIYIKIINERLLKETINTGVSSIYDI